MEESVQEDMEVMGGSVVAVESATVVDVVVMVGELIEVEVAVEVGMEAVAELTVVGMVM